MEILDHHRQLGVNVTFNDSNARIVTSLSEDGTKFISGSRMLFNKEEAREAHSCVHRLRIESD